jgi:hypothetical protein
MSELALKATHALHVTTLEHGSIFTSGPMPENPPKRYFVENVQMNYHSILFVERKTEIPDCLRAARLLSPRLKSGALVLVSVSSLDGRAEHGKFSGLVTGLIIASMGNVQHSTRHTQSNMSQATARE